VTFLVIGGIPWCWPSRFVGDVLRFGDATPIVRSLPSVRLNRRLQVQQGDPAALTGEACVGDRR
jgi:hypothetical protein